jgi:hypothetical protein
VSGASRNFGVGHFSKQGLFLAGPRLPNWIARRTSKLFAADAHGGEAAPVSRATSLSGMVPSSASSCFFHARFDGARRMPNLRRL